MWRLLKPKIIAQRSSNVHNTLLPIPHRIIPVLVKHFTAGNICFLCITAVTRPRFRNQFVIDAGGAAKGGRTSVCVCLFFNDSRCRAQFFSLGAHNGVGIRTYSWGQAFPLEAHVTLDGRDVCLVFCFWGVMCAFLRFW